MVFGYSYLIRTCRFWCRYVYLFIKFPIEYLISTKIKSSIFGEAAVDAKKYKVKSLHLTDWEVVILLFPRVAVQTRGWNTTCGKLDKGVDKSILYFPGYERQVSFELIDS